MPIKQSVVDEKIFSSTSKIMSEIKSARIKAHIKHGENSIETIHWGDFAKWIPILGEEFGEVCESLTYDKDITNLRDELIDVVTVGIAWIAAIDSDEEMPFLKKVMSNRSGDKDAM